METMGRRNRNRGWDQAGDQGQQPALLGGCGRVTSTSEAFRRSSCILSDLCDNVPELFLSLQYGGLEVGVGGWEALPHPSNLYAHGSGKKNGTGILCPSVSSSGPLGAKQYVHACGHAHAHACGRAHAHKITFQGLSLGCDPGHRWTFCSLGSPNSRSRANLEPGKVGAKRLTTCVLMDSDTLTGTHLSQSLSTQ